MSFGVRPVWYDKHHEIPDLLRKLSRHRQVGRTVADIPYDAPPLSSGHDSPDTCELSSSPLFAARGDPLRARLQCRPTCTLSSKSVPPSASSSSFCSECIEREGGRSSNCPGIWQDLLLDCFSCRPRSAYECMLT